jgi:cytoskeletal protein CcmA (bactofilin family)|uniref:bactofilin family protein n=1 Tax=Polynucleobacter sp. TaxID=2029855 RepID=UPI0040471AA0
MNASDSVESFDTLIGAATRIEGRMVVNKSIRLDGTIDGSIESSTDTQVTVAIGNTGLVHGDVRAHRVLVNGQVDGNIYARERCELHQTSKVKGDIHYGMLGIEHGAEILGLMVKKIEATGAVESVNEAKDLINRLNN